MWMGSIQGLKESNDCPVNETKYADLGFPFNPM